MRILGFRSVGACRPHRLCHLAECKAELNVALELSCVKSVLPAVCGGVELKKPELDCAFGKGDVEIQHMVAAFVVVVASAVVCVLTVVPNVRKSRHCGRLSAVDLFKESGVYRSAIAADSASVEVQCACKKVFVACHDVCEISERLGCVPLGTDVDVDSAAPCCIAFGSCLAKAANKLLQGFNVGVGKDRCDHFAFLGIGSRNADILLEFPFPSALVPSRPGAVSVAFRCVFEASRSEECGGQLCGFVSGDAVHLDLDPDGLLFHFCYLVFCSLAHFRDLRFGLFSLSVVTYYL